MPQELLVKPNDLHFDPANPRLIGDIGTDPDKEFRYLITDIGVEDLLESISTSGLFSADPLIVRDRPEGGYYVLEGNRRLAAIKLLIGERPRDGLPTPPVPVITEEVRKTLETIRVQIGWPENLLQAYLGYKHVTASREWSPEAKAKFVLSHANGDFSIDNLRKFARTLGTKYPTLKRWLIAYLVLRQAEKNGLFDPEKAPTRGYFGTFYTLLGGEEAQNFLGIKDAQLVTDPIPQQKTKELGEFVQWTIGTKDRTAIVNSRQQKQFERVLASPSALEHFRMRGDISGSLLYTEYNADEIAIKFQEAAYSIEDCLTQLFDVRQHPKVKGAFSQLERAFTKARHNMTSSSGGSDSNLP